MGAQAFDKYLPRALPVISNLIDPLPIRTTTTARTSSSSSSSSSSSTTTSLPSLNSTSISASSTSSVSSTAISSTSTTTSFTSSSIQSSPSYLAPTVTQTVTAEPSPIASPPAIAGGSNTSFLQNRVASGFVFTIVGIFGLVLCFFIATFFIRRRKNKRLIEDAVSFDPVTVGYDDMEKAKQSSSLGHGSHDVNIPPMHNHYSPPSHYGGPLAGYTPQMAAQLYAPPARYGSPPLTPVPMQQYQYPQRHPSYISAMSSAEDANYSTSGEMRVPGGPGGQVPEGIRRQYSTS